MHPSPNCHWSANDRYTPQALIHYIISEHQVLEETLEEGGDDSEAETTRDSVNDNEGYFTRTITQRIPNPRTIPWTRMTGEFTGKMTSTKHYFASTSCVTYNSVCLIKISGHRRESHQMCRQMGRYAHLNIQRTNINSGFEQPLLYIN
jgi:hypothetical protein